MTYAALVKRHWIRDLTGMIGLFSYDDTQSAVQYRRGEDFIYLMERETLYLGGTLLRSGTLSQICDPC